MAVKGIERGDPAHKVAYNLLHAAPVRALFGPNGKAVLEGFVRTHTGGIQHHGGLRMTPRTYFASSQAYLDRQMGREDPRQTLLRRGTVGRLGQGVGPFAIDNLLAVAASRVGQPRDRYHM